MQHYKAAFGRLRSQTGPAVRFTHAVSSQTLLHADAHGTLVRLGTALFGSDNLMLKSGAVSQNALFRTAHPRPLTWVTTVSSVSFFFPGEERFGYCAAERGCMRTAAEQSDVVRELLDAEAKQAEETGQSPGSKFTTLNKNDKVSVYDLNR